MCATTLVTPTARRSAATRARTGGEWRGVLRRFGRVRLAMFIGAVALGSGLELALKLFGATGTDVSISVGAALVAFNMIVPMLVWSRRKARLPLARAAEIAASVVLATGVAIALHDAAAISSEAVLVVQQLMMLPAMLGAMLWRADSYDA